MADKDITTLFNIIYDKTYKNAFGYVVKKCGNTYDIADILQDIYTEVYGVLDKKGMEYINNYDAFVLKIAKSKVYSHYSFAEKFKRFIPMSIINEDDIEVNANDFVIYDYAIDNQAINNVLLEQTAYIMKLKPQLTQKVFYLYYYNDLTISQIAKELNISECSVKNKLYRTVKEIREIYKKGEQNE